MHGPGSDSTFKTIYYLSYGWQQSVPLFQPAFQTSLSSSSCAHLMLMLSHFGDCGKCFRIACIGCRSSIIAICKRDCFNPGNNRNILEMVSYGPKKKSQTLHYHYWELWKSQRVHFSSPQQYFFSGKCCRVGKWSVYLWKSFVFDGNSVALMRIMSANHEFHWSIWKLWAVIFHY